MERAYVVNFSKNLVLWVLVAIAVLFLFNLFQAPPPRNAQNSVPYSDFIAQVGQGEVWPNVEM